MFFIMYGYKSVWIRSLSDVGVRKSCIKEEFAFLGNLNLEKLALICWFWVKCIFLLCKTVIYICCSSIVLRMVRLIILCSRSKASFWENVDILWIIPIGMLLPIGMIVFVYNE